MEPTRNQDRHRPRIVLAEDDAEMRSLLSAVMRRDGYEVVEAPDGVQLLLYLEAMSMRGDAMPRPDLLVSDIRMPGYSGLQLVAAMREAEMDLPVILVTAFSDASTRDAAHELDAMLLDKPIDIDDLRRFVRIMVC